MIRLAIMGAAGRMGRSVVRLASADDRFEIVSAIERPEHHKIGTDCGVLAGVGNIDIDIAEDASFFDVIVDFSSPDGTSKAVDLAIEFGGAIVCGTTGLDSSQLDALVVASDSIGVFRAPNFSTGIWAMSSIVAELAQSLPESDVEIVEGHHRNKADAPSGTAAALAEVVASARGLDIDTAAVYGRRGHTGPRRKNEIGIHSLRFGGVIGEHEVIFATPFESIKISHSAVSRDVFAAGALEAAAFIHGKIGYLGMEDIIKSNRGTI